MITRYHIQACTQEDSPKVCYGTFVNVKDLEAAKRKALKFMRKYKALSVEIYDMEGKHVCGKVAGLRYWM